MSTFSFNLRSLKNALATAGLALMMAVSLLGMPLVAPDTALAQQQGDASARDSAERAAEASAARSALAPDLPLSRKVTTSSSRVGDGDYTMSFYYCEGVYYDDPDFNHPSQQRLLHVHTVEGLNLGDELDTWDYVFDFEGYYFFDAYPARPVVVEDESLNGVELNYMNPALNEYTVNYYRVCDGADNNSDDYRDSQASIKEAGNDTGSADHVVEIIDGKPIKFEKIKSITVDSQPFNILVHGEAMAHDLDDLMYVSSHPASIRVSTKPEDNVINLVYADSMASLPDDVEIVETPEDAEESDDESNTENGSGTEGDTGNGSDSDGDASDGGDPDAKPEEGTGSSDDTSAEAPGADGPGNDSDTAGSNGEDSGEDAVPDEDGAGASGSDSTTVSAIEGAAPAVESSDTAKPAADATLPQTGDPLATSTAGALLSALAAGGLCLLALSRTCRSTRPLR